jgi:integral membrane protein
LREFFAAIEPATVCWLNSVTIGRPALAGNRTRMTRVTTIGRLRAIGLIEGASFLLLLGVAMPLKYFAGMPQAVTFVGWVHGLLFITFCIALLHAHQEAKWTVRQSGVVLLAALLPFGPFVIDGRLRREDRELRSTSS